MLHPVAHNLPPLLLQQQPLPCGTGVSDKDGALDAVGFACQGWRHVQLSDIRTLGAYEDNDAVGECLDRQCLGAHKLGEDGSNWRRLDGLPWPFVAGQESPVLGLWQLVVEPAVVEATALVWDFVE